MSYGKSWVVLVFLLISAGQLPARNGSAPWPNSNSDGAGRCPDIELSVKDKRGIAIMGATVLTEFNLMPFTTDSQGFADLPCPMNEGNMMMMKVSAPGYRTSKVTMLPGTPSRLEVILDSLDTGEQPTGLTVNAQELARSVREKSQGLQNEAASALSKRDYDTAGKLLIQAMHLTPSDAVILNNLGAAALGQSDLNAAATWFEQAMKMAPYKANIMANLGVVRWMQHRNEDSYELLKKASSTGYENGPSDYILGTISLEKGLNKEAAEKLKKASPDQFPYRDMFLSIALRNLGKTKAADAAYRNFLKHNPVPYALNMPQK